MMILKFLATGNWLESQVSVAWTPSTRRIDPQAESAIEQAWVTAMARPGVHLFDGPMCRLESFNQTESRLRLTLSKSNYKLFLGTNMTHPDWASDLLANPLGVSAALSTADGLLLLGRRNSSVAYHPDRVHPFAGCMEPRDENPFASARRELQEELSLSTSEYSEVCCTGLIQACDLRQPEIVFSVASSLTKDQIEAKLDVTEHRSIWSIPASVEKIEAAVKQDKSLTPVAVGALLLWGRLRFGQAWFANASRDCMGV